MTQRRYYADSYMTEFESEVLEATTYEGQPAAILAETCFYPTGGGQPFDLGTLGWAAVLDVVTRPDDNAVLHILDKPLEAGQTVSGVINWQRRFDLMQQHTGQHILSRAFEVLQDGATVGFHLTENNVTIDLDNPNLPPEAIAEAETLANQIVMGNVAVRAWFPDADELAEIALRKISDKVTGDVRVVSIGEFDFCACGGTHVANTGEIGMIKVIRTERTKKVTRLEFRCGGRALADYDEKNRLLLDLAGEMTISYRELPDAVGRLQADNKNLNKALKGAQAQLLRYEADELWTEARDADPDAGCVVVSRIWEGREVSELNGMVQALMQKPKTVVLMAIQGDKAHMIFGCSEDLGYDVVPLLKACMETLGTNRGGGRPTMAQGGGFSASYEQLESVMEYAKARALRGK